MLSYAPPHNSATIADTFERTTGRTACQELRTMDEERFRSTVESQYLIRSRIMEDLYDSLRMLEFVPDDWNSYGSPRPSTKAIALAERMLDELRHEVFLPRRVLPSAEGGVALTFLSDTENRAVIESLNNDEAFVLLYDRRGNTETLHWSDSGPEQVQLLARMKAHLQGVGLANR
jgi:hypothetical protein